MIRRLVERLLDTPQKRLAARSVVVALSAGAAFLYGADEPFTRAALESAGLAAWYALLNTFTPLNALVGWWKGRP